MPATALDNHLLEALPSDVRRDVDGALERVHVPATMLIYEAGGHIGAPSTPSTAACAK